MAYKLGELGQELTNELYEIVLGGDGTVPPPKNRFISWCQPGIPFSDDYFDFAAYGLNGVPSGAPALTAEATRLRLDRAYSFARLVDAAPEIGAVFDHVRQQTMFSPSGEGRISSIYGDILRFSKVIRGELTDAEQAKIAKFRALLRTTKKVRDLITDEEREVTEDGPMLRAYNEKQAAYRDAVLLYNAKRLAAELATGPEGRQAVLDYANNAELYRMQVRAAADAWTSAGYRNEIDSINAYIDQTTRRDMVLWKREILRAYEDAVLETLGGQKFHHTTLVPGDFAATGWTDYSFRHDHKKTETAESTASWKAGGKLLFGLFRVGGSGGGESSHRSEHEEVSSFAVNFSLSQRLIHRHWLDEHFLTARSWTLPQGRGWAYDLPPSDGGDPPRGMLVGYPLIALFVRDLRIESAEFARMLEEEKKSLSAGGSLGWGPFSLGGNYARQSSEGRQEATTDHAVITAPGLQLIGFVNHLIGKAPNPMPELKDEDFE